MATEGCHPYISAWWPPGHLVGYQNAFVNEFSDFFRAIAEDTVPKPGFDDGLENQKVLDAVLRSVAEDGWVEVG